MLRSKANGYSCSGRSTIMVSPKRLAWTKTAQSTRYREHQSITDADWIDQVFELCHQFTKIITEPMMNFKAFYSARATLDGIETGHTIRKKLSEDTVPAYKQFMALAGYFCPKRGDPRSFIKFATQLCFLRSVYQISKIASYKCIATCISITNCKLLLRCPAIASQSAVYHRAPQIYR
jgi:hypothetical protein